MKIKTAKPLPKILPGAVCRQLVRCGKPNCKCARGELHGPYHYYFVRHNGVLVKRYVRADAVERTRAACDLRRAQERRRREASQLSVRRLVKLLELVRESETLLADTHKGQGND